jgi:hypothetical protein
MTTSFKSMNLLRNGLLLAALAAVACGSSDDDRPKKAPPLGSTGGRTGSGGRNSGGSKTSGGSGGVAGDGGPTETGGSGGEGSGGDGGDGSGGAPATGGVSGSGGAVVEPTCTLSTGNEICDGCIHSDCSFQCAACEGNEDCSSMVDCVLETCTAGFTGACVDTCRSKYPDGSDAFNEVVFNCGKASCSSFCPFVR